jgi:hypothetical protein
MIVSVAVLLLLIPWASVTAGLPVEVLADDIILRELSRAFGGFSASLLKKFLLCSCFLRAIRGIFQIGVVVDYLESFEMVYAQVI